MKKIRIKICDLDENYELGYGNYILKILKKYYNVELSESPDYIFYRDSTYGHLKYKGIKIFYTGENVSPNFNLCDYAIGHDFIDFGDRYHRFPIYLINVFFNKDELARGIDTDFTEPVLFTREDLANKIGFCSFTFSNYLADETRDNFFKKLNEYKRVDSGGAYLNNVGGRVANKLEFEEKHKFVIAFENSSNRGYITDRLPAALAAKTIPIYWGDPQIGNEFNEKRFINCHKYKNLDEVVERVKEIDNDDDLYLSIINQPVTVGSFNYKEARLGLENFLKMIIDQPLDSAGRIKINPAKLAEAKENEKIIAKYVRFKNLTRKIMARAYKPFKKISFFEKIKYKYFKNNLKK